MGGDIIFIAVFPSVNQSFCLGLIIQTFLKLGMVLHELNMFVRIFSKPIKAYSF